MEAKITKCKYLKAWIGKCEKKADETKICKEHTGVKCVECGKQAVQECDHTGSLVCGAPLCKSCKHQHNY